MTRIFNTIRQRMLAENRFTRYMVYAIGEIVLVMVGILLALQVSTWNQDRQARKKEQVLLQLLQLCTKKLKLKMKKYVQLFVVEILTLQCYHLLLIKV